MRLIDGDALLEQMKHRKEYVGRPSDPVCLVEDAPIIAKDINVPNNGWISVKDRLPKSMANKVLVWLKHEDLNSYIGYGHYEKFHGEEMWYDLEHGERFDKRGYIVTHWMPLPEPPKEESND